MSVAAQPRYTPEQYLALERASEYKSEYINGQIYAMAGASREHNQIVFNLAGTLHPQLRDRPCEAYVTDMRVRPETTLGFFYPDVVVVCDTPRFEDADLDTLTNPTVVLEVLSPSTEGYDRGAKFAHYRRFASLQEYVLIAQDRYSIERYARSAEGWLLTEVTGATGQMELPAIGCTLRLQDVYNKVALQGDSDATPPAP